MISMISKRKRIVGRIAGFVVPVLIALVATVTLGVLLGQRLKEGETNVVAPPVRLGETLPDAAQATPEDETGPIELVDLANREFDGAPALALTFTRPLDARQDYDSFISVLEMPSRRGAKRVASNDPKDTDGEGGTPVKGSWVVGDNPRLLYFPHVKPDTRYVVRVAPGIPAQNKEKTTAESRYGIVTNTVSPSYYFASRGVVLPARQNGGLPVVTVNVPEVDLQFLRVKPEKTSLFLREHARLQGAVGDWQLDHLSPLTESVYAGRFLTEKKPNRRGVTFLPVEEIKELSEPGIYIAIMTQPNRFRYESQVTYFYVSNLGLHARLFEKGADVYVSALDNGKALAEVEVSWLGAEGDTLLTGKTDDDGRAQFTERPENATLIMARQGRQISLIATREPALDLSEYEAGGAPGRPVRLFAYSGRNLYRPGERFDVSILARSADGEPIPAQPIQAILKAPDGKEQFTATWQPEAAFPGYYQRALEIPADATTGFWNLELRADPAERQPGTVFRFGVEEFLPERMKLDLDAEHASLDAQHDFAVEVTGNYLYGAPAVGNRLLGVAQYSREKNPFAKTLPGFEFGDANEDAAHHREELAETKLDTQGRARLDIDLANVAGRHSPFQVRATLSLLESGGRPVVRSIDRTYWPASDLLGVRPLFTGDYAQQNHPVSFEVVRVNAKGELSGGAFPVRLFRENREYYWRFEEQGGWQSGYTEADELVASTNVAFKAGERGRVSLPTRYGRYRLEINDPETGKVLRYRFYVGWSAKAEETAGIRPDRVGLKFDKPAYREGEIAHLTITPPHGGEALLTVESDATLWVKRLALPASGATVDIPVGKDWLRHDLYVSVMVLRPGDGSAATPTRALGLLHLPLARDERKLAVELAAPKKIEPETALKARIRIPDAAGQKALVTLSAVDVGILNITRFATPDPFGHFFSRLRYGADQYDVYGRLIERMAGLKGKLRFGGDAMQPAGGNLPKKVRMVDLFSGPVALDAKGEAEITLPVPDFNGQLRLMAVAATENRFGNAEAEVVVVAPLVAELATPRFLSVGDSAIIALDLHNLSGAGQSLQVEIGNAGGLRIRDARRQVRLKDQEKVTLRFPVETGSAFGLVPLSVKVTGSARLNREFALQVEAPTPRQSALRRYSLAPGERVSARDPGVGNFLPATVTGHLTLSTRPPLDVRGSIQGLLTYPYGCTEQTTSTAYPHVFINEAEARSFGLKPYTQEEREEMLEKAIARLGAMQAANGGFSLWGQVSQYEYWLSAYVSNFLLDAREQGFAVPDSMSKKALDFLFRALQEGASGLPVNAPLANGGEDGNADDSDVSWGDDDHYGGNGRFGALAYGAYVLARESRAPLATLRQMYERRGNAHSGLGLVHLGLALTLMGDEERGRVAIAEGVAKAPRLDERYWWWGDYGSPLRDAALSYMLLEHHKITVEGKENLLVLVAQELEGNKYTSTQEKLALFLAGRQMSSAGSASWSATLERRTGKETLTQGGDFVQALELADLAHEIGIVNTGSDRLYVELATAGHAARLPAVKKDVVALSRKFYDMQGQPVGNRPLRVGESVLVMLEVSPRSRLRNALVVDRIPAGLEIENLNLTQGEHLDSVTISGENPAEAMQNPEIQHVEFRDDRFVAAVRLDPEQPLKLFYRARAVTPGRFVMPSLYAEDMYRPNLHGISEPGGALTITDER